MVYWTQKHVIMDNAKTNDTFCFLLNDNIEQHDDVLGPVDYIASRRTKNLVINVPVGENLVLITAEPDADDKSIIKKAEKLFDEITISTI